MQVLPTAMADVGASSNLNVEYASETIPNLVIAPLGVGGSVSIYTQGGGQLIADLFGYFVESSRHATAAMSPCFPTGCSTLDQNLRANSRRAALFASK